MKPTCFIWGSD